MVKTPSHRHLQSTSKRYLGKHRIGARFRSDPNGERSWFGSVMFFPIIQPWASAAIHCHRAYPTDSILSSNLSIEAWSRILKGATHSKIQWYSSGSKPHLQAEQDICFIVLCISLIYIYITYYIYMCVCLIIFYDIQLILYIYIQYYTALMLSY